jgi:glycolate oxidase iron-sulfur subunit
MTTEKVTTPNMPSGPLSLIDDELATCVACGLCLPHCPTFRVTGEESASPRGRIAAMRAVQRDGSPIDDEFVGFMDACVQCRGCETACPSGVPFGRLMEGARSALAATHRTVPRWQRLGYRMLRHHRLLLAGSTLLALAQRLRLVPKRLGLARLPITKPTLVASGADVWLFTGCVMDAWQRDVHVAAQRVVEATGAGVALPGPGASCCGALHVHAGLTRQARKLAGRVMVALDGDAPILVDSAGCGAALKDYGHLLDTDDARAFSARVFDIHEWLADRLDRLPPSSPSSRATVIVQDPCHLRHVQRAHLAVRTVVSRYASVIELDDDGLCCGAGGAYSALHPEMAADIRERKLAAIERAKRGGAEDAIVVSANPGCSMHLAAAGVAVRHPIEIVADALRPTTATAGLAPSR